MGHLVIFSRLPMLGAGKTRLAREVGAVAAARAARQMLACLLRELMPSRQWQSHFIYAPVSSGDYARHIAPALLRQPQGAGDLGQRLSHLFSHLSAPVVVIGSDCPYIRRRHIAAAFTALRCHDAVLGPASDGGFWLIGLRVPTRAPRALRQVRWSSSHALADMIQALAPARIALLEELADIDDGQAYRRWMGGGT